MRKNHRCKIAAVFCSNCRNIRFYRIGGFPLGIRNNTIVGSFTNSVRFWRKTCAVRIRYQFAVILRSFVPLIGKRSPIQRNCLNIQRNLIPCVAGNTGRLLTNLYPGFFNLHQDRVCTNCSVGSHQLYRNNRIRVCVFINNWIIGQVNRGLQSSLSRISDVDRCRTLNRGYRYCDRTASSRLCCLCFYRSHIGHSTEINGQRDLFVTLRN